MLFSHLFTNSENGGRGPGSKRLIWCNTSHKIGNLESSISRYSPTIQRLLDDLWFESQPRHSDFSLLFYTRDLDKVRTSVFMQNFYFFLTKNAHKN
jgi:hypothetical protein